MTDRIQVGDLVYYTPDWNEERYYCVVHSTIGGKVWGTWRDTPDEARGIPPRSFSFMPEDEVFLTDGTSERKGRRPSNLKGIAKFLDKQEETSTKVKEEAETCA